MADYVFIKKNGNEELGMSERNPTTGWHSAAEKDPLDNDSNSFDDDAESAKGERHTWGNKVEYILSMLGYCVGLGNVWRFPYICIRNGGGAFLVPFFICLVVCGLPLYFLEVALAQFFAKSAYHVWAISPMFRGIGLSMIVLIVISSWYYIMILAWISIFLINSFKSPLPWTLCGQAWNTNSCVPLKGFDKTNGSSYDDTVVASNGPDLDLSTNTTIQNFGNGAFAYFNESFGDVSATQASAGINFAENVTRKSSSEEFWLHNVLNLSPGLEHIGDLQGHLALALLVVAFIVYLCLWKGVKSVGKVVYVTATLPYVLITVLLIRGATLPGATDGLLFFVTPRFSKLWNIHTWIEACVQIFYSLGPSWGTLITMASYNKFNNNCMKDAIYLSFACEGTSVFTGLATMSFLGHMAYKLSVPVETFASSGPGLTFVVYPEAIAYLPLPQLWGVLFFIMLFSVGLDSQFSFTEVALTFIADLCPRFMRRWSIFVKSAFQIVLFLMGLIFCTEGGMYVFQLVDWYIGCFTVMMCAFLESVVVSWVYGTERFSKDIELMIGRPPYKILLILLKLITPTILLFVCLFTLAFYEAPVFEGYVYPTGAIACCWLVVMFAFALIPLCAVYTLFKAEGTFMQRLRTSCTPSERWLPSDKTLHKQYREDNSNYQVFQGFNKTFWRV